MNMNGNGLRSAGHLMRALASTTSMALPAALASPIPLYWLAACPKDLADGGSRQRITWWRRKNDVGNWQVTDIISPDSKSRRVTKPLQSCSEMARVVEVHMGVSKK